MAFPRILACVLALVVPATALVVVADPSPAAAAQPAYDVGTRLKARQDCTIGGYAIKKGVVLTVTAVTRNDKNEVTAVDLSFEGMNISQVDIATVKANFDRA